MTKQPYLSVNAQFIAKDLPDGYRGLSRENWTFGKSPTSLDQMIAMVVKSLVVFYASTVGENETTEDINADIRRAGEAIAGYYLKEVSDD